MGNMGYIRFENTLRDLRDCLEHMDEKVSDDEAVAREQLVGLCEKIAREYGDEQE